MYVALERYYSSLERYLSAPGDRLRRISVSGAKHFEDLFGGKSITTAARTLTEADLVNFCSLTGDWDQLHSNELFARDSYMGQRVFAAPQLFSYAIGLVGRTNIFKGTVKAILGFDDFSFHVPVHPGEIIYVVATMAETNNPGEQFDEDIGWITLTYDIQNKDGDTVGISDVRLLVFRRTEEEENEE